MTKAPHRMNTSLWSYSVRRDPQGGIRVHRTWLKMVANPVLRLLGWRIVSVFIGGRFVGYQLLPLTRERQNGISRKRS